jgi:asparagine synthase (glutamine-hydrolysing)
MCGIAGWMQTEGPAVVPQAAWLQGMQQALRHRGPDGEGLWRAPGIGLAHTRLALVGVQDGAQPLSNEDGSLQLVCNGEIYNHQALRQRLVLAGHQFRTHSDSEVILHLYEDLGEQCLAELNGPFALALWDGRRQCLLLARDRVGMRPLYWTQLAGALVFASEVKAFMGLPGFDARLDETALVQWSHLWAPWEPQTFFQGVHSLPTGHWLRVPREGQPSLRRWWDWSFQVDAALDTRAQAETAREIQALLADSVRQQLQADLPVGVYLSGGLDSAAIGALVAQQRVGLSGRDSFSLGFEDPQLDERAAQAPLAGAWGMRHHTVLASHADVAEGLPRQVWHAETPVVRTAGVPMMMLARRVRDSGLKAVLSGEGADELFAGYDAFKEAQLRRFVMRQPASAARRRLLERLYPDLAHGPAGPRNLAGASLLGACAPDAPWAAQASRLQATSRLAALWHPDWLAHAARYDVTAKLRDALPDNAHAWPPLGREQWLEAHTLLSGYLLSTQGDRMAMAHGVELRHPFLDHRLIELAGRLPPRWKLQGLQEKAILRQALKGLLPEATRLRRKQAYRAPDVASFFDSRGHMPDYAEALLAPDHLRQSGWFDEAAVSRLVRKCRGGRAIGFADNMAFVGTLSLLLWRQQFLRGQA